VKGGAAGFIVEVMGEEGTALGVGLRLEVGEEGKVNVDATSMEHVESGLFCPRTNLNPLSFVLFGPTAKRNDGIEDRNTFLIPSCDCLLSFSLSFSFSLPFSLSFSLSFSFSPFLFSFCFCLLRLDLESA